MLLHRDKANRRLISRLISSTRHLSSIHPIFQARTPVTDTTRPQNPLPTLPPPSAINEEILGFVSFIHKFLMGGLDTAPRWEVSKFTEFAGPAIAIGTGEMKWLSP